jgi:uncharacterized Ntn-hydrolase superfamily protein
MLNRFLILLCVCGVTALRAQDTFSIVAVDTLTGEIGSAGATCLARSINNPIGALIISDVIPGVGAIHTQAYWRPENQLMAHDLMVAGLSPHEILDSMQIIDVDGTPEIRQYGVVDFRAGHPRSAGFTGPDCDDYKNHIVGANYAIQGNILLGQQILDSIEARFLRTEGTLGDKLMAALEGANVPGADTRCLDSGKSSASSFIRVAKPGDDVEQMYLDLIVTKTPAGIDPIDSLQTLYTAWNTGSSVARHYTNAAYEVRIDNGELICTSSEQAARLVVELFDVGGRVLFSKDVFGSSFRITLPKDLGERMCFVRMLDGREAVYVGKVYLSAF